MLKTPRTLGSFIRCVHCGVYRPRSQFRAVPNSRLGTHSYCWKCQEELRLEADEQPHFAYDRFPLQLLWRDINRWEIT